MNDQDIEKRARMARLERDFPMRSTRITRRITGERTSVANEAVPALSMATAGGLAMAAFLAGITALAGATAPVSVPTAATVGAVLGAFAGLKAFTDTH